MRSMASRYGASWVICEPIWQSMPFTLQAGQGRRVLVGLHHAFVRNAKLVAFQAGGDVGMGLAGPRWG